jgi:hypothetical protein
MQTILQRSDRYILPVFLECNVLLFAFNRPAKEEVYF